MATVASLADWKTTLQAQCQRLADTAKEHKENWEAKNGSHPEKDDIIAKFDAYIAGMESLAADMGS